MQWLIDLVMEWHEAWFASYGGYHDRGDPATWDWILGDLVQDGAWHELDLSGIVTGHPKAICLNAAFLSNELAAFMRFRKPGNINAYADNVISTSIADVVKNKELTISLSDDTKIEYVLDVGPVITILLTVKGWWF